MSSFSAPLPQRFISGQRREWPFGREPPRTLPATFFFTLAYIWDLKRGPIRMAAVSPPMQQTRAAAGVRAVSGNNSVPAADGSRAVKISGVKFTAYVSLKRLKNRIMPNHALAV